MESNLRRRLTCPSCNRIFKNPRTLSCGHTFCSGCMPSDSPAYHDGIDVCTICDEPTSCEDVECAPYVLHLLEVFTKLESAAVAECYSCTNKVTATSLCIDCDEFYCQRCLTIHNKIPSTCKHKSCLLKEFLTKDHFAVKEAEVIECSSHLLPIELYCFTCEHPMCKTCIGGHESHEVEDIKIAFQHLVSHAKVVKEQTEVNVLRLDNALSDVEAVEHSLEHYKRMCLEKIADTECRLLSLGNKRIRSINNQLELKYQSKLSFADTQVKQLSKYERNLDESLKIMNHLTEVENPALVMDTCTMIVHTLQSQNDKVNDLEPVINQHMGISTAADDLIDRLQMVPDIVWLNGSIAKNCKLNSVTSDVITHGHMSKLYLQTNDIDGNAITIGGADVRAIFKYHTGDYKVEADVLDRNDGSYDITASCNVTGKYSVETYVFDRPIPDVLEITAVRWVAPKQDYVISKGEPVHAVLQAIDDYDNIIQNAREIVFVDLISPTDDIINLDVIHHNGAYEVKPTLLVAPGHWKISFRGQDEDFACVDIHVLEWCFEVIHVFKQLQQSFEINITASGESPLRDPENEPMMCITLVDPKERKNTLLRAVKTDERNYRLTLTCDKLGQWLINASVFDWPLQRVTINIIEWIVDTLSNLTRGEHFEFRVWARDVHGNEVEANAVVKSHAAGPTGQNVDFPVVLLEDGVYIIKGIFDVVGLWSLEVTVDDLAISPININVLTWKLDADSIVLTRGESFQRRLIAIDSNGKAVSEVKGSIYMTAVLHSATNHHNIDIITISDGSHHVKGEGLEVGDWKLQIMMNGDILLTSLDVHVIDWAVDKRDIKMSVGQTFIIIISAIDANGDKYVVDKDDVSGILRNPNGQLRRSETVKLDGSSYQVTGACNVAGLWSLDIVVNGHRIHDLEVLIDVVKEEAIKHVETRSFWGNNMQGKNIALANYSCGSVLLCNNSNEILQLTATGTFLTRICLQDEQRQIISICSCDDGRIFLLDKAKREVLVLPRFVQVVSITFGSNELRSPFSVTIDKNTDHIFVVDNSKHCVLKFSFSGKLIMIIGLDDNSSGKLKQPTFAAINIDGNLLISDTGNSRIQMYNTNGDFLKTWKNTKSDYGFMVLPQRLLVHKDGKIVITSDHKLQLLDEDGRHIKNIHEHITRLVNPHGIAVTSEMSRRVTFFDFASSELLVKEY